MKKGAELEGFIQFVYSKLLANEDKGNVSVYKNYFYTGVSGVKHEFDVYYIEKSDMYDDMTNGCYFVVDNNGEQVLPLFISRKAAEEVRKNAKDGKNGVTFLHYASFYFWWEYLYFICCFTVIRLTNNIEICE